MVDPPDLVNTRIVAHSRLDWLITIAGAWTMTGLFIDGHEHLFETIETFLNPWHIVMYSGGMFAVLVLAVAIAGNRQPGRTFWQAVPIGYEQSVVGVACLILGGTIDFVWHAFYGFEHQLDLLVSPPHLFLLTGLFFLVSGPVRSALGQPQPARRLLGQAPMLISMGLAFEVIQFVTQVAFYPEALMRDHPLSQIAFRDEQFVLSVILFYRQSLEMMIVIWQSALLAGAVLYLASRTQLRFGALAVLCVAEKIWIGGELSRDIFELILVVFASITAGLAGDVILAKVSASLRNPNGFRILGIAVPAIYFAAFFAAMVPLFGGTWWDPSFVFGAIAEAGIVGACISQLVIAGFHERAGSA